MPRSFPSESFTTFSDLLKYLRCPNLTVVKAPFIPALHLENDFGLVARFWELTESVQQEHVPAPGYVPYKRLWLKYEMSESGRLGRWNFQSPTLEGHVQAFTLPKCHVYTDEYDSYNGMERTHSCVAYGRKEWARDDDGDGIREAHTNTAEGMWTGLRNFLRPFRDVHKKYMAGYVAIHECRINLKRISPAFIAALVKVHSFDS